MTKGIRRLLSLAFVLALLLSLAMPAFAEGSISGADEEDPFISAEAEEEITEGGSISSESQPESKASAASSADREIYVSADGDDMADGSREHPLETLAAAAELANDAAESTVYVILLSDLTVSKTARFNGKDIILMSENGTALVTRDSGFEPAYDQLRRAYNPAMIELGELQSDEPKTTSLSLDNVVLDDAGLHEGTDFLAQSTDPSSDENNLDRVQDAIVALYGSSSLTLNPGSELRNFGGMSAVHAVGAGSVTIEDYSKILDTVAVAAPAGLKAINAEGAEVRIGTYAEVIERGAAPAEEPAEEVEETPAEEPAEEAEETPAEEPAEEAEETPAEEPAEEAEETPAEEPAEEAVEPAEESAEELNADALPAAETQNEADQPTAAGEETGDEGGEEDERSDLLSQLLGLLGGDDSGFSLDSLTSMFSNLPTGDLANLVNSLTNGETPDWGSLISNLSPDDLGKLIGAMTGDTGTDWGGLIGNLSGSDSALSWTTTKEELYLGETPYEVPYILTVNLPDTLVKVISAAAADVQGASGSFTITLDSRMSFKRNADGDVDYSFQSDVFQLSEAQKTPTDTQITIAFELKEDWADNLAGLNKPIVFTVTGVLDESKFQEDDFLISKAKLDSLNFVIRNKIENWNTGDVELEAKTKMLPAVSALLTYDRNGGEGGPEPVRVAAQTGYELEKENVPTHKDTNGKPVVFLGWTEKKDTKIYSRKDTAPATLSTIDIEEGKDVTVYAAYGYDENEDGIADASQRLVELSFDANGGAGAPDPILAVAVAGVGASIDIPEQEPTLKYYTFQGWSKDQDATEADYKYNASKKSQQDILITKDTVLYAVWKQNPTYTLYYNANGGSGAPAAQSGISDENDSVEMTIASGQPTRPGYSFLGWAVSRSGTATYFAGNKVKITGGNVTLYAVWQKGGSSYSGGGSGTTAPKTGDEAPIALYAALAVISLGAVGAGAWLILRNQKKKK